MTKKIAIITDDSSKPIGTYSQAVRCQNMVFISAQSPNDPDTDLMVEGSAEEHIRQSFKNVLAVADASGGDSSDIVKITLYLQDLAHFPIANDVMKECFSEPYPARSTIEVSSLPDGALAEIDAIMMTDQ